MEFHSCSQTFQHVPLEEALFTNMAPDGTLWMPSQLPQMSEEWIASLHGLSLQHIALDLSRELFGDVIDPQSIREIVEKSITFNAPLINLSPHLSVLELFHGPTLSFKDFGARYLARLMSYFLTKGERSIDILTATSGDTGSAVGHAFWNVPGITVWILYPQGQVSPTQEKQIATLGRNVHAIEVQGTFDDCQSLVKRAFCDPNLKQEKQFASANSINIGRLLPQMFYYFYAVAQMNPSSLPIVVSVPSGNFGNLTAGLLAKKMGLPVQAFIASTNINDTIPHYLKTGIFQARPSKRTLSNAMDVGNPSNAARMMDLFDKNPEKMRQEIKGYTFTDDQTVCGILEAKKKYNYLLDPHGAVAYLGLEAYRQECGFPIEGILLETAHPAKFREVMDPLIHDPTVLPPALEEAMEKQKQSIVIPNDYKALFKILLRQ